MGRAADKSVRSASMSFFHVFGLEAKRARAAIATPYAAVIPMGRCAPHHHVCNRAGHVIHLSEVHGLNPCGEDTLIDKLQTIVGPENGSD